ncbi:MAG: DMT family transporter [Rhodospirillales bacterium]|jgi:drug/metabolite transporter (DMT)-like permease|nr:DMT family transporter [Rhodospirillales bacterium]
MDNIRGSGFMVLAMAAFTLEDMFLKSVMRSLPIGETLILFGIGGMLVFCVMTMRRGERVFHPAILTRTICLRAICELTGRLCFAIAIALTPLSSASAILQATPLVVAAGGMVFFGETVGWRRWLAIAIGFGGVLLIIRPGLSGFEPLSIFALISTLGFAGRDLATRAAPPVLSNMQLGVYGFFILIPAGIIALLYTGGAIWPTPILWMQLAAAITIGVAAYNFLTVSMRVGEVSVITPFRYTRLVFAMIIGALFFAERPDAMTMLGSAIIVASGLYTILRERKLAKLVEE